MGHSQIAAPVTAVEWGDVPTEGGHVRPGELPGGLSCGDAMGPYIVRRFLGQGGMGTVYAAEDPRLGREVALKVMHKRPDDRVLQARRCGSRWSSCVGLRWRSGSRTHRSGPR